MELWFCKSGNFQSSHSFNSEIREKNGKSSQSLIRQHLSWHKSFELNWKKSKFCHFRWNITISHNAFLKHHKITKFKALPHFRRDYHKSLFLYPGYVYCLGIFWQMQEICSPSDMDVTSKCKWEPDYTCHGRPPVTLAICLHTQFVKFFWRSSKC